MMAAKLAIRAHWPASSHTKSSPMLIHLLHCWGLGGLERNLLLLELLPGLAPPKRATRRRDQGANGEEQPRRSAMPHRKPPTNGGDLPKSERPARVIAGRVHAVAADLP